MSDGDETEPARGGDRQDEPAGFPDGGGSGAIGPLAGLGQLFGEARDRLDDVSKEAANVNVTGRAGGGAVEVTLNGNLEAVSVKIAKEIVDPDDVGLLEDLVLAALRHALADLVEVREQAVSTLLPGGLDLEAMMGSLFGGAGAPGTPSGGFPGLAGMPAGLGDLVSQLFSGDDPTSGLFDSLETDFDDDGDEDDEDDDSDGEDGLS